MTRLSPRVSPRRVISFVTAAVFLFAAGCRTPVAAPPIGPLTTSDAAPAPTALPTTADAEPAITTGAAAPEPADAAKPASTDLKDLFAEFIAAPERESFLKVRAALVASADYDPYSTDLDDIGELVEQEKFDEAKTAIAKSQRNLLLSPRFHWQAVVVADKTGQDDEAVAEFKKQQACLTGILSTGEGTEKRPYFVTRVDDEYDLLRHLKKQMARQSLRHRDDRSFDVLDTADGQEIWFDITDVFATLAKKFGGK